MDKKLFEAVTDSSANEFQFKWTITNFSYLSLTEYVYSPEFQIDPENVKWKLRVDPDTGGEVQAQVQGAIGLVDSKCPFMSLNGEFILLNSKGHKLANSSSSVKAVKFKGSSIWIEPFCVISRENLLNEISHDDKLIVICDLRIVIYSKPKIIRSPSVYDLKPSLTKHLAQLRANGDFSDSTIYVRGETFYVHKALLAARSPVFSSMFKHEMKEATSGKVEIEDMEPEVFREFLNFIYTGNAKVEEYASELLAAADKYDMQDLKAVCEEILLKNLSDENCFKTLLLSDLHSAKKLKELTMMFIFNRSPETATDGLAEIENSSLLKEIIIKSMEQRK